MHKNRLEAFSDGVLAIAITIMVLELKAPSHGSSFNDLSGLLPNFGAYVLSFLYIGIYWNNHHHMLHTVKHVGAGMLWHNLHLLFWLSLFPVSTAWAGHHPDQPVPVAVYGFVLAMAGLAYFLLQQSIIAHQGKNSLLAEAVGSDWKGKLCVVLYFAAVLLAFVEPWFSNAIYLGVALLWVVPDRRIERTLGRHQNE